MPLPDLEGQPLTPISTVPSIQELSPQSRHYYQIIARCCYCNSLNGESRCRVLPCPPIIRSSHAGAPSCFPSCNRLLRQECRLVLRPSLVPSILGEPPRLPTCLAHSPSRTRAHATHCPLLGDCSSTAARALRMVTANGERTLRGWPGQASPRGHKELGHRPLHRGHGPGRILLCTGRWPGFGTQGQLTYFPFSELFWLFKQFRVCSKIHINSNSSQKIWNKFYWVNIFVF
jgi:hypothetical protein